MAAHETTGPLTEIKAPSERAFGFVFAGAFALLALLEPWSLAVAAAFAAAAILAPARLAPLNRLWFRFGLLLHKVVSPLVLGLMFFGVVLPTGVLARLAGKDFLAARFDRAAPSYWERRARRIEPESFRDQF